MSLSIEIEDGTGGTRRRAGVTPQGQLIVGPVAFNETYFQAMTAVSTAYNFVTPQANYQFVIDGIVFSSDKGVSSTNGVQIIIYEAQAPDTLTVEKELFRLDLGRLDKDSITGLNVSTTRGTWVNAKIDDNNVNVTIVGYFIPIE